MNANQLTRISDAITLERARASDHQDRGADGSARRENHLFGASGPGSDLRGGGSSNKQIRGRGGDHAFADEIEAMKQRLLKHAFLALIVVLMFIGWHIVNKWPL